MELDSKKSVPPVMRQGQAIACRQWAPIIAAEPAAGVEGTSGAGESAADFVAPSGRVKRDS